MDDRVMLPVNTVLDGAYRIVRVVGSGGFGITYEAEDIKLRSRIAIKEYYPHDFGKRDAAMVVRPKSKRHKETFDWGLSNFLLEARTLARFEHPSIVRVARVFETNSTAYMVMRFEQGRSFEDWLRGLGRPPTQDELDAIVAPLLDALEVMHAQKFLHRDIAPDNIIIRTDTTPVLLDFGAARRAVAEKSRVLTGIVKAGYSPHEQYASDGRLQGPWSDFYALGGTLYRAVTGSIPEEATLRVTDDRTPAAAAIAKGTYRPGFLAAIDACLRVRQTDRPQSVAKLRPLLFKQESQPQSVLPPKPQSRPPPKSQAKSQVKSEAKFQARSKAKPGTEHRVEAPVAGAIGRRVLVIAATLVVLGGGFGGYQYANWATHERPRPGAEASRKAQQEARQWAEAKKKTDEEAAANAEAKAQAEARQRAEELAEQETRRQAEAEAAKRQADEEAAAAKARAETEAESRRNRERAEQEQRRQAEADRKKSDEDAAAKARVEAEGKRKATEAESRRKTELADQERRDQERREQERRDQERRSQEPQTTAAFDGMWEITRVGGTCITGPPIIGVTIVNGMFAQGFGTVSPSGEFRLLGRSQNAGPRDLHYTGKLAGASGSGKFQTQGGACTGTFTAKQRRG